MKQNSLLADTQISHLDSRNYTTEIESRETLKGNLEVTCILNPRITTDLNTSGAAHLFCISSHYYKGISREGKAVPCGSEHRHPDLHS